MKKKTSGAARFLSTFLSILMVITLVSLPAYKVEAEGSVDDFVERCYIVTLDRPSDPDGFADWKGQLLNGKAVGVHVAYGFLFSKEYTNKNKSNEEYVKDLYMLFMGREPDEAGFNDWVGQLDSGKSRVEVFVGFANSQEFFNICSEYGITAGRYVIGYDRNQINNVNLFVERLYSVCLGRKGDKDGQKNWVEKLLNQEITGAKCAVGFVKSQEFQELGLNNEDYVIYMYKAILGRESDPIGKADWVYKLDNGLSRDELFEGFANSNEFNEICKSYGIIRGDYKATDIGTYNPQEEYYDNHIHFYSEERTEAKYLKTAPTCTEPAEYYLSCYCGKKADNEYDTFIYGEPLGHEWDEGRITQEPTSTNPGEKTFICTRSSCSEKKIEKIPCIEAIKNASVGDIIKFGIYEQDGNLKNGKEDITWRVLSVEKNRILVISEYILDKRCYDSTNSEIRWDQSELRTWLNEDFYNEAFNKDEREYISLVTLVNKGNSYEGTSGGINTKDKIFVLSVDEVEKYFKSTYDSDEFYIGEELLAEPTKYALNNGIFTQTITKEKYNSDFKYYSYSTKVIGKSYSYWWLRTPSTMNGRFTCTVNDLGFSGLRVNTINGFEVGVRPTMYLTY